MPAYTARTVSAHFATYSFNDEQRSYIAYHARRYAKLLTLIAQHRDVHQPFALLDVGPAFQTELIRQLFPPAQVDSLGFPFPYSPMRAGEEHTDYDLNNTNEESGWIDVGRQYDCIVFCEVLEHLYTSPRQVLRFLRTLLKPGGLLILQTPNAVCLPNRLMMLAGRNPFMLISEERRNPGHYREYTRQELHGYAQQAGLGVRQCILENYFEGETAFHKSFTKIGSLLPPALRQGITMVLYV